MILIADQVLIRRKEMQMKKKIVSVIIVAAMSLGLISGCRASSVKEGDRETIEQVSLLQGLTLGDYHGSVPAKKKR